MKTVLNAFLLLFLFAAAAAAQTPTLVTGTIKDTNGVPYSFAKVSAQLIPSTSSPTVIVNGIPAQIGGQQNANADVNGNFTMNLFCNSAGGGCSVISPAGTQWQITVNENGTPPPLGTGPQACTATITVTGASQSVSASFSACPALSNASGGVTPNSPADKTVATLPGSPATGDKYVVTDGNGFSCSSGGGVTRVICRWNGASWEVINAGPATPISAPNGGTGVASPTAHALLAFEGASPAQNVCTPPATNGDYNIVYHITGAAAVDPTCPQIGLGGAAGLTGAATTYTVLFSDNGTILTHDKAASGAINVTLNTATTLGNANFTFRWSNHSAQSDTITPTTWTIQGNASAGGATLSVPSGVTCLIKVDPNLATQWVADCSVIVPTSVNIAGGTAGFLSKFSGGNLVPTLCDEAVTTANTITCTDTAGFAVPKYKSTGTTAGFMDYVQGATSAADPLCATANSRCVQAPAAVTASVETIAAVTAQGTSIQTGGSSSIQDAYSGDANHSTTVTTGSGTSIGSTSLCSTGNCPVGTYRVNAYIDITTACTTTGTYIVNLIYTDDQASKTVPINIQGTGTTPTTGSLALSALTNFGQASQIIRSTGAASINYSTTATACGSGGPMVGKLYLSVEPVQ